MKAKKLILGLTMAITMGLGVTAYAASTDSLTNYNHQRAGYNQGTGAGLGRATGMRGYDYVETILKDKLGITDAEITAAFDAGKTMYDLAKEKGMTEDEFKTALLEERNKAIDKAVAAGTITIAEGDSIKETLKINMDTCTGIPGQGRNSVGTGRGAGKGDGTGQGFGNGAGRGHMSGDGMRGLGNCYLNDTVE
jgi:hypothetical protein